ncbi:hypothetical protein A2U01_0106065, partial [Trifolium medium]|nr:hypothetical protein [Trifolium medium]
MNPKVVRSSERKRQTITGSENPWLQREKATCTLLAR